MSALIQNNIKIDESAINKILKFVSKAFKEFLKQPAWLLITVSIVIISGALYFRYSLHSEKERIQNLQEQVQIINKVSNENLSISDYEKNLLNVITSIKLLKQENQQSYEDELLELDLFIAFIEKYHPKDPIIADLNAMKSRLKTNHDMYQEHFDYVIKQLDIFVNNSSSQK